MVRAEGVARMRGLSDARDWSILNDVGAPSPSRGGQGGDGVPSTSPHPPPGLPLEGGGTAASKAAHPQGARNAMTIK